MAQRPYDYTTRQGVQPISWEHFHGICKALAVGVAAFAPEIILAIGRGGSYPGTLLAHLLRTEVYPVCLSRRVNDIVKHKRPQWLLDAPALIRDRRVLVVDEICDSGETIRMVKGRAEELGAREVRSAVLYAHTWSVSTPDYIGLISDALLLNPWDREILVDGEFRLHPEYEDALVQQGATSDASLRVQTPAITLAKQV